MIAFASSAGVRLIDLATCRESSLAFGPATDVRFSPDGRWIAYSRVVNYSATGPMVVAASGGRARSPLGGGILAWGWAPSGELLYGITDRGSLVAGSPTGARRLIATGLGTSPYPTELAVSPTGDYVVVDRSGCPEPGELVAINVRTGARRVAARESGGSLIPAGFSPDGRWLLFWGDAVCSASLAADGSGLRAVSFWGGSVVSAVSHMLHYPDFLSWCGQELIAGAGPDRETQTGGALVQTGPPGWHQRTLQPARKLSWVSPSCAPSGQELAAAAGANNAPVSFGLEHRSIWLLRVDGAVTRRLTSPPARSLSDEAPRFSRDGRWILFVRSRVITVGRSAISRNTIELVPAAGGRPVPVINFTSNDFSYYDHFDWPYEIDWYQPRPTSHPKRTRESPAQRLCRTSQLLIRTIHSYAGLGTSGAYIAFTNTSRRVCELHGWPKLAGVTAGGRTTIAFDGTAGSVGAQVTGVPVVFLKPGMHADAPFAAHDGPIGAAKTCPPPYRWLRIAPPGDSKSVLVSGWIAYLNSYLPSCAGIGVGPVVAPSALYGG